MRPLGAELGPNWSELVRIGAQFGPIGTNSAPIRFQSGPIRTNSDPIRLQFANAVQFGREKHLWQTLTFICLRVDPSMLAPPHNQGSCRFFWRQSFAVALETRGQEGLVLCIVEYNPPPKAYGSDRFRNLVVLALAQTLSLGDPRDPWG